MPCRPPPGELGAVISGAAVTGCVLGGLADGVAGALVRVAEVGAGGWRGPGCFDQGLLGWRWSGRRRLRRRWSRRGLLGGGLRCRRCWSFRLAHRLQLPQGLLIELLGRGLLRYRFGLRRELGQILGRVEEGELLLFALLENVDGADKARLVEEDARSVEQEPDDRRDK